MFTMIPGTHLFRIGASGKIEKANFFNGSELLHDATESLKKARFEEPFPPNSTAHLLRKDILSCSLILAAVSCFIRFRWLRTPIRGPQPDLKPLAF
jgi:hypothetical protein